MIQATMTNFTAETCLAATCSFRIWQLRFDLASFDRVCPRNPCSRILGNLFLVAFCMGEPIRGQKRIVHGG